MQPPDVLDEAVWLSLTGAHAQLSEGQGAARRYRPELSPFAALAPERDEQAWQDLRALVPVGESVVLFGSELLQPGLRPGWQLLGEGKGLQLTGQALDVAPDVEAVVLGDEDVDEMVDLVARTEPGPFTPQTHLLGRYLGLRRDGRLLAMAGERVHPPGWTEISAVCTDPAARGQGLASRLVRAVAHGVRERGELPMLHVAATNVGAVRLYTAMGFVHRRDVVFTALRAVDPG